LSCELFQPLRQFENLFFDIGNVLLQRPNIGLVFYLAAIFWTGFQTLSAIAFAVAAYCLFLGVAAFLKTHKPHALCFDAAEPDSKHASPPLHTRHFGSLDTVPRPLGHIGSLIAKAGFAAIFWTGFKTLSAIAFAVAAYYCLGLLHIV